MCECGTTVEDMVNSELDPNVVKDWVRDQNIKINEARAELNKGVLTLRRDGWSWARLGELFGCSRQAAWERFHEYVETNNVEMSDG